MGNDKAEMIAQGRIKPRAESNNSDQADYKDVDGKLLQAVIGVAAERGGALRLGLTRDRGAFAIGVYYGEQRFTDYIRPSEDINDYFRNLLGDFENSPTITPRREKRRG